MTNETFTLISPRERNAKFRTVLKQRTDNRLTEDEVNTIVHSLSLSRQYSVRVYESADEFRASLVLADASKCRTVLGSVLAGFPVLSDCLFSETRATAYITQKDTDIIHIYIPKLRALKGCVSV